MTIRTLVASDASAWWHLRLAALEREPLAFGMSVQEHRARTVDEWARRFTEVPRDSFHLGAFEGEQLIGIATFMREAGLKERHKGHITGFFVDAAQRRRGVARALLAALLERARASSSLEQILLGVASTQHAAQRLYRSVGFETYGTEPNALKVGEQYVDEHCMILRLR